MNTGDLLKTLQSEGVVVVPDALPTRNGAEIRAELARFGQHSGGRTKSAYPLNLARHLKLSQLRSVATLLNTPAVRSLRAELVPKGWVVSDVLGIEHEVTSGDIAPWHRDAVGRQARIKFYWYLSNTDAQNGAFCYVRGSHRTTGNAVPPGDHTLAGKAGTLIVFDEHGLHRGGTVAIGHRSILRVSFWPVTGKRALASKVSRVLFPAYQQLF
jgi:hypothetical protein